MRGHNMRHGDQARVNVTARTARPKVPGWFYELHEESLIEAAAVAFVEGDRPGQPSCDEIIEVAARRDIGRYMELQARVVERAREIGPLPATEPTPDIPPRTCRECRRLYKAVTLRRGLCGACWKREWRAQKKREAA